MSSAATYGRLRYDIHTMFAARQCASAGIDSRDPVVDSGLIAGTPGLPPRYGGLPGNQPRGVADGAAALGPLAGERSQVNGCVVQLSGIRPLSISGSRLWTVSDAHPGAANLA